MTTIKHTQTLVYYDGVQVFAGQDAGGDNYIGAMIDTVGDADHYLVVAAPPDPLRRFYAGELDLRTLLLESSASGWYTALVDDDFAQPVSLEPQQRPLLEMDYLPEAGFCLREAPSINPSDDSWNIAASPTNADSMSINALDRLAVGLSKTDGTYAVLLGSGISKAAGIPTGWEIAVDLISQIARLRGEDHHGDPEGWYHNRFGRTVNYSDLVESLANTPAERNRLLSGYIEPSDEDRRAGRKQPTAAHKAIANLVKHGCIRYIITTNIDPLMEMALAAEQIYPRVVSSPDDFHGLLPLSQLRDRCLVIKIHGDYRDIRSLHTASELAWYPEVVERWLDQIFSELGMIVCGWSAQWDVALCNAVKRSVSGTYSWFWAEHGATSEAAEELITYRNAERISIDDADSFFQDILRRVERLLRINPQNQPPVEQGVAVLQRYFDQHLGSGGPDVQGDLSSVVSQLFALSSTAIADPHGMEDSRELARRIDFARQLIEKGLVVQARKELEQISATADQIPEDLQLRIATNLCACAMAEEDVESAVSWSEEAYRLQPDNPNVVANAALAAHQANDTERALKLAHKSRELNLADSPAASVIMIEMWRAGEHEALDKFVASEDWVTHDAQCALVLANIRLLQSRFDDAVTLCRGRVAADDQDAFAHLALSQSLMQRTQANRPRIVYTEPELEQLKEVVSQATKAINLLRATELNSKRHAALVLRGCGHAILEFNDEAMEDFDEVLREQPDSSEAAFYKALLLLNDGQFEQAANQFSRIGNTSQLPDLVSPFAHSLLLSGNHAAAVSKLRDSFNPNFPEWEDVHRAELLLQAESLAGENSTVIPALAAALRQKPTSTLLLALDAMVRDAHRDTAGAENALQKALENATGEQRPEVLLRLGNHYNDCDKFSEAADCFSELVDGNPHHPLAVSLLVCLNNSKRVREALTWSRTLQKLEQSTHRIVEDIELNIFQLVGDAPSAVAKCERICDRPDATPVDRVQLSLAQIRSGDFEAAARTVQGIDRNKLLDSPLSLLQMAQIKRFLGVDGYADDAYAARRHGFDNAEVHLGYFSTVVGRDQDFVDPELAGPGCAVLLRRDTEEQWWSIVDHGEQPTGSHELAPDAELSAALTDKRAGDTVLLRQGLEDLSYEVVAVQSKFVRAFQETAAEFSTRFPNNMQLSRVAVDAEDPSKFLEAVDQRDKFVRGFEQLYREGKIPLVTFAHHVGKFPLEVWRACTQHGFTRITFGFGNDQESDRATVLLNNARDIVLDTVALFTVYELRIIELLRDRFDRVYLPQLVFDDLRELAFHCETMEQKASGVIGKTDDGRYSMSEISEDARQNWQQEVESVRDFASSFDLIPSYGFLNTPDVERWMSTLTTAGAGSIWASDEESTTRPLLVSDDLALSNVANALDTSTVNTQALLLELHQSGSLSSADYSHAVGRLVAMNYWFVRVRSEDIIRSFEADGYVTTDETRAMLRTLQGPDCLEDSAVSVAANVVVDLSSRTMPGQFELILWMILATLRTGRETNPVLLKFREAIETDRRLSPLTRQRIRSATMSYLVGGMTRAGHSLIVPRQ